MLKSHLVILLFGCLLIGLIGCKSSVTFESKKKFEKKVIFDFPEPPKHTYRSKISIQGKINCDTEVIFLVENRKSFLLGELNVLKKGQINEIIYLGDYYDIPPKFQIIPIEEDCGKNELEISITFYK